MRALLAVIAALTLLAPVARAAPPSGPAIVPTLGERDKSALQLGEELFAANCARCHGIAGRGVTATDDPALRGPALRGVGALAPDFYLRTGYMPLASAYDQPIRSRVRFSGDEVRSLVTYVASLGAGPPVPRVDPAAGDVAEGRKQFTEHCAGCHQAVAEGGVMTGAKAPPLDRATPVQIAEAVRLGPYAMPPFPRSALSDDEVNSIIAYVQYAKDPRDAGGWGINHLGPFPEGMVTWFMAVVVLIATCMVIGKRRSQA